MRLLIALAALVGAAFMFWLAIGQPSPEDLARFLAIGQ